MTQMTLGQLMKNPAGPSSGHLASRRSIIADLEARYLRLASGGGFSCVTHEGGGRIVFVVRVPSETTEGVRYDVVIEAEVPEKETLGAIMDAPVRVFSNSPSFAFTYAYVARAGGLLVEWLSGKLPERSLTDRPGTRNPPEAMGFEKTIFFACRHILAVKAFSRSFFGRERLDEASIAASVRETSKMVWLASQERKRARALRTESRPGSPGGRTGPAGTRRPPGAPPAKTVKKAGGVRRVKRANRKVKKAGH